jgi:hypothetical protein
MRKTFMGNPILCDLILIRSALSPKAAQLGVLEVEKSIASLVEAGLSAEDAFETYSAVSVHVRGSVVLQRLYEKNLASADGASAQLDDRMSIDPENTPLLAKATADGLHRIATTDDANFEYALNCILDHAERLIAAGPKKKAASKTTKSAGRARKAVAAN